MTISNSLDILIITETWLTEGKDHSLCMLRDLLPDFRLTSITRASRGGGLAILYRSSFIPKVNSGPVYSSFEYLDLTLSFGKVLCRFISFYRPPPSTRTLTNSITFTIKTEILFGNTFLGLYSGTGQMALCVTIMNGKPVLLFPLWRQGTISLVCVSLD